MAITGAKRKVGAVRIEEKEDSSDAKNGGIIDDNDAGSDDGDDGTSVADETGASAKTPAANKLSIENTPGSSGGMYMRSGRKKKRRKPNNPSANESAAQAVSRSNVFGVVTRKRSKKSANEDIVVEPTKQNGDISDENEKNHVDNDEKIDAEKVAHETTREVVAAAQVTEPTAEAGGDEEKTDNHASSNGGRNSSLKLVAQKLRLPSQQTPKPSALGAGTDTATPAGAPPPGGRRLLFQSAHKSSSADGTRNTLLMQTRQQQQTTSTMELPPIESSQPTNRENFQQNESGADATESNTDESSVESTSFFAQCDKEATVLYTQAWFLFLTIFFVFGNFASVMSRNGTFASEGAWGVWNMTIQGQKLADWYGVEPARAYATIADAHVDNKNEDFPAEDTLSEDEEPETIIETVTVTSPALLSKTRAALRAHRINLHDIQKIEASIEELQKGMGILISGAEDWSGSYSEINIKVEGVGSEADVDSIKNVVMEEIASSDIVIFSKSSCPHCKATKDLLNLMTKDNGANFFTKVIELDMFENGAEIHTILFDVTGQKTVPNIFVKGRHVGGNDQIQEAAKSGELESMLKLDMMLEKAPMDSDGEDASQSKIYSTRSSIAEKQKLLLEWERALVMAEETLDLLSRRKASSLEVNEVVGALSEVSMIPGTSAMMLDADKISVPGGGCAGLDYISVKPEEEEEGGEVEEVKEKETVEVVGGIDVNALGFAKDSPLRLEDAETAHMSLSKLAQATIETFIGKAGPSSHAKRWVRQTIQDELQNEGVGVKPQSIDELHQPIMSPEDIAALFKPSDPDYHAYYTAGDAIIDIDRLLETEDADRTDKFDYASIVHGASVIRRGPYATSYSLYETLPLVNRILAYVKLRFYGHPPEVALLPTFPMYARGQCWSFPNEFASSLAHSLDVNGIRGEYATLTMSLTSAITITDVMIEHVSPNVSSDPSTAIKEFRVVGFEDGGAYGEPWELGIYKFLIGPTMQAFSIPTVLDGQNVPKLKSVAIAVDSNWGNEDYACLYRVRVHGA